MQIEVQNIQKTFRVSERKAGAKAAISQFFNRQYRNVEAIKDISFNIDRGELIGYLGPNGAGKSTTIKMLTGILVPDSGRISIGGRDPNKDRQAHAQDIGVVFGQKTQLWWDLPLADSFALLKAIYKVPDADYLKQWQWLIQGLGIDAYINQPVRQLSLGQRMRAELVASLLHMPAILFLDEPTIGLDATSKQTVRTFIKRLNAEYGTTVILTTHDMDDIEALCNRVMVIDKGSLAFDGSLLDLRKRVHNKRRMTLDYNQNQSFHFCGDHGPWGLTLPNLQIVDHNPEACKIVLEFDPELTSPQEVIRDLSLHLDIKDLLIENPPIEEIISRLYGEWS